MRDLVEQLQLSAEDPAGGIDVIRYDGNSAADCWTLVSGWGRRAGFIPLLAGDELGHPPLPASLRHRHVLIVSGEGHSRETAIRWIRELAAISPRRHLVVAPAQVVEEPKPGFGFPSGGLSENRNPVSVVRERRAARWHRRGRARIGDRWLVAAIESARRHDDEPRARCLDIALIESLISRGDLDEPARRLRHYLTPERTWADYADAAALQTDILIARLEFGAARAWTSSVLAESALRGEPPPVKTTTVVAELDFWQGRHYKIPSTSSDPDQDAWQALSAWCARDAETLTLLSSRLAIGSVSDERCEFWRLLLDLLTPRPVTPCQCGGIESRRDTLHRIAGSFRHCAARRKRLVDAVAARRWLAMDRKDLAHGVVRAARINGPEELICRGLVRPGTVRVAPAGVQSLTSWRDEMPLVDGLPNLLSMLEEADDEVAVLGGGCEWLSRRGGAVRAAIVSADGGTLLAGEGWRQPDLAGEIAEILRGPDRDARAGGPGGSSFGVSIRSLGVTTGYVVVRGRSADCHSLQQSALILATLCGPAVRARLDTIASNASARHNIPEIVGESPLMAAVRDGIVRAAAAPFPVLIEGESGTGKELVARALHRLGPRRDRRLSAVNCAALTDELVEAELFGHVRGAFTGAIGPRVGLFEESHGGTLFLDEVTELSARAQAKLLRVLQEREIRRVGENQSRAVDVRIVSACNTPIAEAVAAGRFRADLRFRLAVVRISLPPLRERAEDIPALTFAFWRRAATEAGTRAVLGPDALARLTRHAWPGNVRELQNAIAGLVVAAPARGRVSARHVEQVLSHAAPVADLPAIPLETARRTLERRVIMAALTRHAGRRHAAALELGLTRQGLAKALRRLGLAADENEAGVA